MRQPLGTQPKLTDEQARAIRDNYKGLYGEQARLAKQFKVDRATIRLLLKGKTYRHVLRDGEKPDITPLALYR